MVEYITDCRIRGSFQQTPLSYRHLPRFYTDRFVRLAPALFAMVATMSVVWVYSTRHTVLYQLRYAAITLFYMENIHPCWIGGDWGPFGNTWSLSVEEQFYIFWSLALPLVRQRSSLCQLLLLSSLIFASFGLRLVAMNDVRAYPLMPYYLSPLTNFGFLLCGAALRLLPTPPQMIKRRSAYAAFLVVASVLVASIFWEPNRTRQWQAWRSVNSIRTWFDPLSAICATLIVAGAHDERASMTLLEGKAIRFVGKISYGWYLWQEPILLFLGHRRNITGVGYTAIAFMAATASTFLLEEPIRQCYAKRHGRHA